MTQSPAPSVTSCSSVNGGYPWMRSRSSHMGHLRAIELGEAILESGVEQVAVVGFHAAILVHPHERATQSLPACLAGDASGSGRHRQLCTHAERTNPALDLHTLGRERDQ